MNIPDVFHPESLNLGKRTPCTVLLSVHEKVKWTLPEERNGYSRAVTPRCG